LDLTRFHGASKERVRALQTEDELDDYTYRVAGCVGEFWTRICRAHLFPKAQLCDEELLANGVRFGKGLQLVNVLRDLPVDLRHGRCYLPEASLAVLTLRPHDLLEPGNEQRLRPLYDRYLERAQDHLLAGWTYTKSLPRRCVRLRLACAWPIGIGLDTLRLLRAGRILAPEPRIKVSRQKVRSLLWRSAVAYPWPRAWERVVLGDSLVRGPKQA
jgi:farnesyl-diphosphate farnesyltransferase